LQFYLNTNSGRGWKSERKKILLKNKTVNIMKLENSKDKQFFVTLTVIQSNFTNCMPIWDLLDTGCKNIHTG
jgi:hypothetical protein